MQPPFFVLASGSPRRRDLLHAAGFHFDVCAPDLDETVAEGETPLLATGRLAMEKALAVAESLAILDSRPGQQNSDPGGLPSPNVGNVILAADTTVVCEGRMIGKPVDEADAVATLLGIAGRNHQVITAWSILEVRPNQGQDCEGAAVGVGVRTADEAAGMANRAGGVARAISGATVSTVRMRDVTRREAVAYVAGGEPMDKAGAYAVQGEGRRFVGAVTGSLTNVIGLPVDQVVPLLVELGLDVAAGTTAAAQAEVGSE